MRIEDLKKKRPVYIGNWKDKIDLIGNFVNDVFITGEVYRAKTSPYGNKEMWLEEKAKMKKLLPAWKATHILFAYYTYEDYTGEAFVLFAKGGKLYEVNASHCSCMGLEDQWTPEATDIRSLRHRLVEGTMGEGKYAEELLKFLGGSHA